MKFTLSNACIVAKENYYFFKKKLVFIEIFRNSYAMTMQLQFYVIISGILYFHPLHYIIYFS